MTQDVRVGDRLTFRAVTRHSDAVATRVVREIFQGRPCVRYHGWPDFMVREYEIISVERRES